MKKIILPDGGILTPKFFSPAGKKCGLNAFIGFYEKEKVHELVTGAICQNCPKCPKITFEKANDLINWLREFKDMVYFIDPRTDIPVIGEEFELISNFWLGNLPHPVLLDTIFSETPESLKLLLIRWNKENQSFIFSISPSLIENPNDFFNGT